MNQNDHLPSFKLIILKGILKGIKVAVEEIERGIEPPEKLINDIKNSGVFPFLFPLVDVRRKKEKEKGKDEGERWVEKQLRKMEEELGEKDEKDE